jgi:hypothetical protein
MASIGRHLKRSREAMRLCDRATSKPTIYSPIERGGTRSLGAGSYSSSIEQPVNGWGIAKSQVIPEYMSGLFLFVPTSLFNC